MSMFDAVTQINPKLKKALQNLYNMIMKPVIYSRSVWHILICVFKYSEQAGVNQWARTPHRWILGLKQRSHSSGSHVSWTACKETWASLSVSTMTLNCLH